MEVMSNKMKGAGVWQSLLPPLISKHCVSPEGCPVQQVTRDSGRGQRQSKWAQVNTQCAPGNDSASHLLRKRLLDPELGEGPHLLAICSRSTHSGPGAEDTNPNWPAGDEGPLGAQHPRMLPHHDYRFPRTRVRLEPTHGQK